MASPKNQQNQQDIDSILNAALDGLDRSDSDEDEDEIVAIDTPLNALQKDATATMPPSAASTRTYGPAPPPAAAPFSPPPNLTAEEAELAASLEGMMQQFMNFNGGCKNDLDTNELQDAEKAMEAMFKGMMDGLPTSDDPSSSACGRPNAKKKNQPKAKSGQKPSSSPEKKKAGIKSSKKENNMDETINNLLNNIQQPDDNSMPNNIDPSSFTDASINSLLNDISSMSNSSDANPLLDTVMKQLLDKELMYQPMKEVCSRFPEWLAKNKNMLSTEEYERYGKQFQYFQRIVRVYEVDPGNFERLMELMQDIQE